MLLPGPEAQKLATYLGWLLHGVRGGLPPASCSCCRARS
jgi:chromate transport protein ChrA